MASVACVGAAAIGAVLFLWFSGSRNHTLGWNGLRYPVGGSGGDCTGWDCTWPFSGFFGGGIGLGSDCIVQRWSVECAITSTNLVSRVL